MTDTNAAPAAKTEVLDYRLHLDGLFGRNRKAKRDSVHLGDVPAGTTMLDLAAKVNAVLVERKAKPGLKWMVICTPTTVEKNVYDGHTVTSRSFIVFSGVKVLQGVQQ